MICFFVFLALPKEKCLFRDLLRIILLMSFLGFLSKTKGSFVLGVVKHGGGGPAICLY